MAALAHTTGAPCALPANDNARQQDRWHFVIKTLTARYPNLAVRAWQARLEGWEALAWCEALVEAFDARAAAEAN